MGSVFSHHSTNADRSASDRRRHKEKIEKAIKDGVKDIVAEESIIGKDGKKKIKIPVKGIKEYKFVFGQNKNNVGAGGKNDIKRGQVIGKGKQQQKGNGNKPGDKAGEEYYEVEVTLEELAEYLFRDLELPDLEKKKFKEVMSKQYKRKGYRPQGIRPRLSKKETAKRRIRRKKVAMRDPDFQEEENFSFLESDLRYKHIKLTKKYATNACIFFVMDISGSMSTEKKYFARSFFFLLYQFLRSKYEKIELVFVSHDTQVYEVDEEKFFNRGSSGGTKVSPALEYVYEQMQKRYNPKSWNLYTFQCSDGDNWTSDNEKTLEAAKKLRDICQLFGYCEVDPNGHQANLFSYESLHDLYGSLIGDDFKRTKITKKEEIWASFKSFFGGKLEES